VAHLRKLAPALAALIALAFLVLPSIARFVFLLDPPAGGEPTDLAFAEHRLTGFLHVVPGLLMVLLMPLQMSARVRLKWPALHRWSGRVFVLTGLLLSITGVVMNMLFPVVGGLLKVTVIYVMCIAEVATLALGMRAIWRRDVAAHRRWMVRAMGVALAAGTAGVFVVPFYAAGAMSDTVVGVGRWLGFLTTMIAVELWLRPPSPAREVNA
jgi:hypothetical protein